MDQNSLIEEVDRLEDFNEADQALRLLKSFNPVKAKELSLAILEFEKGDVFLQSTAFDVLYSIDRNLALSIINKGLYCVNLEVFRSMIESVTVDSTFVEEIPELLEAVKLLSKKILGLNKNELEELSDSVNWFRESFQNHL